MATQRHGALNLSYRPRVRHIVRALSGIILALLAGTAIAGQLPIPGETAVAQVGPRLYLPLLSNADHRHEPVAPDWVHRCPANTVPFEEQAWWINDFGHVHAGFCAPQHQVISGKYTFNVRLIMHDNPGVLKLLQGQLDSTRYGGQTVVLNATCRKGRTCSFDGQVTVNTAEFPYDGWHQIRIRAVVEEPDGKEMVASSFVPVYFSNGKPRQDLDSKTLLINTTTDYIAGRGWYTGAGYVWSIIFDPPSAGQRVKGLYKVRLRSSASETVQPVSRFLVKLDATHTDPGITLYDVVEQRSPVELTIDTTTLTNGWHSLLARTESAGQAGATCPQFCSGQPQTHAGVTKIWFYVDN